MTYKIIYSSYCIILLVHEKPCVQFGHNMSLVDHRLPADRRTPKFAFWATMTHLRPLIAIVLIFICHFCNGVKLRFLR